MTVLTILFVGLMLGMQHATEADHLAAVATLATRCSLSPEARIAPPPRTRPRRCCSSTTFPATPA